MIITFPITRNVQILLISTLRQITTAAASGYCLQRSLTCISNLFLMGPKLSPLIISKVHSPVQSVDKLPSACTNNEPNWKIAHHNKIPLLLKEQTLIYFSHPKTATHRSRLPRQLKMKMKLNVWKSHLNSPLISIMIRILSK